jgi:subtilisin
MASPHVAGTAALVWAANSGWLNDDVRYQLQITAEDLGATGWDNQFGYGLVDADEAAGVVTPPPIKMYVSSIDMILKTRGPWVNAISKISIADENGTPVEGAAVSGHWSGATDDTNSGTTKISGQVSFKSDRVKNSPSGTIYTFTVDDVMKDGWTYDPINSVTTANILVP